MPRSWKDQRAAPPACADGVLVKSLLSIQETRVSLLPFVMNAGAKLDLSADAAGALTAQVLAQHLHADGLAVSFDLDAATVTVEGEAPDQAILEKIVLVLGNVRGVRDVDIELSVAAPGDPSQFYDVRTGDSLSKIAANCYGDANDFSKIVDANQPMIVSEDKIYPGQKLRIPPKTW
jgi:LysM repeat protein